ncbi:Ubiquitin-like protein 3 [Podila verticillata]|nr:Ubiquitin-like protein 3 [Podila verticillata]
METSPASLTPTSTPPSSSPDSTISLTLLLVSGARTTFTFAPAETIESVKAKVFGAWPKEWTEERPASPQSLKILYLGKFLADTSTLESNKIQPGTTTIVHLTIKAPEQDIHNGPSKSDSAARCRFCLVL